MATRINNISDIVPFSVLKQIAERVREKAIEIAKAKRAGGKGWRGVNKNTVRILEPKVTQNQASVNIHLLGVAAAYEWGSGEKRKRGTPAKYPIRPKKKRALAFYENERGTWDYSRGMPKIHDPKTGKGVFFGVMHPGVEAKPFLEPAKRATRKKNLEDLRSTTTKNIRLAIMGMAKKI